MKLLFLDIEIAPSLATVWGLRNAFLKPENLVNDSYVLSWAAKWYDSDEVEYSSLRIADHDEMIVGMYELLEQADAVVTYNGDNFDLKILNQEFLLLGLPPPAPYKSVDLLKTMRKRFRGTSNKLNYWLKRLNIGQKVEHRGYQLWLDCMDGNKKAFVEMETYNIGDVVELENLYKRVLPWITNNANRNAYDNSCKCPHCGSKKYQLRGWRVTTTRKYRRAQCTNCGGWFSFSKAEPVTDELVSAAR